MKLDPKATALICAATEWGARPAKIEGAIEGSCFDCGQPVWVAPSGMKLIAEHNAVTLCGSCGAQSIIDNPDTEIGKITDEQRAELIRALERREE